MSIVKYGHFCRASCLAIICFEPVHRRSAMSAAFAFVVLAILLFVAYWTVVSWLNTIKPNEVGLRYIFGWILRKAVMPGLRWLPWFPGVKFIRVPTTVFPLEYEFIGEGMTGHREEVWSLDYQRLYPEVTLYLELPWKEPDYLIRLIQADVPFTDKGLTEWAEDVIITALRQVLSKLNYRDAISNVNLKKINKDVNAILRNKNGVLFKVGFFGKDPYDDAPGTGQAFLQVELILTTPELQKKLETLETTKIDAETAKNVAKMNAEAIGGQILGTVARICGMTLEDFEEVLAASPELSTTPTSEHGLKEVFEWAQEQTTRDRAVGGYTRHEEEIDVSSGKQPIKDSNLGAAIGAAAGIASQFQRGKRQQKPRGPQQPPPTT